jgi:hypothetical protein
VSEPRCPSCIISNLLFMLECRFWMELIIHFK